MSILASEDIIIVNELLTINGTDASTNNTTGALVVTAGGVSISENLNCRETLTTNATATFEDTLTIGIGATNYTFPTVAGSNGQVLEYSTTGALVFTTIETADTITITSNTAGQNTLVKTDGTGKDVAPTTVVISDLNDITGVNSINIDSNSTIGSELHIKSITSSNSNTTGALTVSGGVGIAENLNVAGDVCIDGNLKIPQTLTLGSVGQEYSFPNEVGVTSQMLFLNTSGSLVFETPAINVGCVSAPSEFGTDNRLVKSFGVDRELESTDVIFSDTNNVSGLNTVDIDTTATFGGILTITDATTSTNNTTGALVIAGGVGIGENLNIGGDISLDGVLTINSTTESTETTSGALIVAGGVGVAGNVYVGGVLVANNIDFTGIDLLIQSTTESTSNTSGALVISGGAGINGDLNIGGDVGAEGTLTITNQFIINNTTSSTNTSTGALTVAGGLGLGENLNMGGVLSITDTTSSSTTSTGAFVSDGGVGVAENVNVGGNVGADGIVTISNTTESTGTGTGALIVDGGASIGSDLYVGGKLLVDAPISTTSKYFSAYHTAVVSVSTTTYIALPWDVIFRKDIDLYTHTTGTEDVTIVLDGWYEITAEVSTQIEAGDGSNRTIGGVIITVNGTPVTESDSYMYNRTAQRGHYTTNINTLIEMSAGDVVNIEINRKVGNSTITSVANGNRLTIEKV